MLVAFYNVNVSYHIMGFMSVWTVIDSSFMQTSYKNLAPGASQVLVEWMHERTSAWMNENLESHKGKGFSLTLTLAGVL